MRVAYFDCFSGISGDMCVGALIHAGASLEFIEQNLRALALLPDDIHYSVRPLTRSAIHATKFDVVLADGIPVESPGARAHKQHHGHHHHHVTFSTIREGLEQSSLAPGIVRRAVDIFAAIARGESAVHNMSVDDVHFHEVGAADSIADIVACAAALDDLKVDAVYTSVIPLGGGGMIDTRHGRMPLPAPATLEILRGYPVRLTSVPFELTTPTGAGIVRALSSGIADRFDFIPHSIGFGAGTRDLEDRPNLLRVAIGEMEAQSDTVVQLETNVDDVDPRIWPGTIDRLLEAGALDAWLSSVQMKKGRPGHVLSLLCHDAQESSLAALMRKETGSLGVRSHAARRSILKRTSDDIDTSFGSVRVKIVTEDDGSTSIRPESDDILRLARERNLPFPRMLRLVESEIESVGQTRGREQRSQED